MASIQFRDKLMARLVLEEIINNTLVETAGEIVPLSNLTVAGFDQDIYVKDLLEDFGWLGSWMHLAETFHSVSPGSSKIFKESFYKSHEWLGGIKPSIDSTNESDTTPRVLNSEEAPDDMTPGVPISFSKTQLLLRMSLLNSISINSENKVEVKSPDFHLTIINKCGKEDGNSKLHEATHQGVISSLFFHKIRDEIAPALNMVKSMQPSKDS